MHLVPYYASFARYVPRGDLFHELKRCGGCFSERCVACKAVLLVCSKASLCADVLRAQARHPRCHLSDAVRVGLHAQREHHPPRCQAREHACR